MRPLLGPMSERERAHLRAAHERLARLGLQPRMRHVRIVHAPWLFRLPWFRRFAGYEAGPLILIREPLAEVSSDLITHELCHVCQLQRRPLYMPLSYLWQGYRDNEHEIEARAAANRTRSGPRA